MEGDKGGGERSETLDWKSFQPESVFGVTRRADNSWDYWLDAERKIAHLRLGNLLTNTPDELYEIVSESAPGRFARSDPRFALVSGWFP